MLIVKEKGKGYVIKSEEIDINKIDCLKSKCARKIVSCLVKTKQQKTAKELAKEIGKQEQVVYYHLRKLENAGIVEKCKVGLARGFEVYGYKPKANAFYFVLKKEKTKQKSKKEVEEETKEIEKFLFPFIEEGKLNCVIVIGSPEPHGIERARSKDAFFMIDLALLFGSFLDKVEKPVSILDTEIRDKEILKNNLVIIGGPIVNTLTYQINDKLPVGFSKNNKAFVVKQTGKKYFDDEVGIIIKQKNPFNKDKEILVIEGKRYIGTKACVVAFMKYLHELSKRVNEKGYVIVKGYDADSDGIIDDVQFLE